MRRQTTKREERRREDRRLWDRVAETVERAGEGQTARTPRDELSGELMARLRADARGGTAEAPGATARSETPKTVRSAEPGGTSRRSSSTARAAQAGPPQDGQRAPDATALTRLRARWAGGAAGTAARPSHAAPREAPHRPAGPPAPSFTRAPAPHAPSLDRHTAKRLSRGREGIERREDLHGLTEADAHRRLLAFVSGARVDGLRHVLVITGKGAAKRGGEGALKRAVPRWLATPPFATHVSGIAPAARHDGGEGALYVRLKRR